jgi:4-hydroxy-tetrahydrodipicolinate reductase
MQFLILGKGKTGSLAANLAKLEGYNFTISETHHISKLDAPSGTAVTLREIIQALKSLLPPTA